MMRFLATDIWQFAGAIASGVINAADRGGLFRDSLWGEMLLIKCARSQGW